MSDSEEHHFESKADAGASKTYPQQAGTIRKNGYIVIKNRPCKVVEISTSKTGKHGHAKCHFVGIVIFNGKKLEDIVPSSHNCDVPHVDRTEYQLIDISEDGYVSLLTENGNTKDDLKLPNDENLQAQVSSRKERRKYRENKTCRFEADHVDKAGQSKYLCGVMLCSRFCVDIRTFVYLHRSVLFFAVQFRIRFEWGADLLLVLCRMGDARRAGF
ncbi:eukaryotic translation initiation factor 5A-like isoform X1 [Panicum hallii]|uniref:eukaryotic translation initiation factor 5A-like isoform X1 n=1 Tax=Panicum hallii TaxID=206008 RepID=UPI000DF4DB0A|nr:eukaryotic translation initiation factor 5A-like isoform X1 [Panicum hallii]